MTRFWHLILFILLTFIEIPLKLASFCNKCHTSQFQNVISTGGAYQRKCSMYEWRDTNNTTLMNINHTIYWILISSFECFHSIVGKLHWTRRENCPNTEFFLVPKKTPQISQHLFLGIYFHLFQASFRKLLIQEPLLMLQLLSIL